jgi:ubiquinone/menaquinone biosynthesis C-methylase UbiE
MSPVDLDPTKAGLLDATLAEFVEDLRSVEEDNAVATLGYTHSIHREWRQVLRMLPIPDGSAVLDVGTGFGILPFELAANGAIRVEGVDLDPRFIDHALTLRTQLAAQGLFAPRSEVGFSGGDAYDLDFPDRSFDLVFMREVVQFLREPVTALGEVYRVLRPGGFACVGDTDDQLRITWPPPSPALVRLIDAVAEVQHAGGGDRQSGRKLTSYLRAAGFKINSIVVIPEATHRLVESDDTERLLIIDQLKGIRPRVLAAGVVDAEHFDADVSDLEQQEPFEEFRLNARIIALAQRPA